MRAKTFTIVLGMTIRRLVPAALLVQYMQGRGEGLVNTLYSQKYWRSLNLAVWPQTKHKK